MTEKEIKKFRHIVARFEGVKHSAVEIVRQEVLTDNKHKIYAKIGYYTRCYLMLGNWIVESWVCVK